MLDIEKVRRRSFQVLFLHNDPNQGVEVHEGGQVDFFAVQQHLEQGESVFITSKDSEKIEPEEKQCIYEKMKTRLVTIFKLETH